jgi:outer membrane protein TolC
MQTASILRSRRPRLSVRAVFWLFVALVAVAPGSRAAAQSPDRLTLEDALRMARDHSEALEIARAGEARADAGIVRAKSQRLPQINFSGSYDRTLASEFSGAFQSETPTCAPLNIDPTRPIADRVAEIERAASCGALGPSFSFGTLPFGQKNIYRLTLTFSQAVYTAGRITAQQTQANLSKRSASLASSSADARVALDVTRAFYDAALSDRLVTIAESGLAQAAAAYDETRLSFDAGRVPEFDLLRAEVARDNQKPVVIRRKAERDLAYLRLRQLLELPASATLSVDVDLDAATLPPPAPFADALARVTGAPADVTRASVQQAEALVSTREAGVTVARSAELPNVSLNSSYGRVGYPTDGVFPGFSDFRTNWTVGAAVTVPIFTGHRLGADLATARADLDEAKAQLKQARELAELDAATAFQDVATAQAVWEASAGTVEQAQRAYEIADLRFREGLSTQLELSDSRLSLQVAQANRAQAARDLQVARARVALLPYLPIGA